MSHDLSRPEGVIAAIREIQDREAVRQVIVSYARALDGRDWDALSACFTADAIVEGSIDTLPIDQVLARSQRLAIQYGLTMHYLANQTVTLAGDEAVADTYLFAGHWKGEPPGEPHPEDLLAGARYRDTLVRADGGWRIRHRKLLPGWRVGERPAEMQKPAQA